MAKGRGTRNPNANETVDEASLGDGAEGSVGTGDERQMSETNTGTTDEFVPEETGVEVETTVRVKAPNLKAVAAHFRNKARKAEREAGGGPARGASGAKKNRAKVEAEIFGEVATFLDGVELTG